MVVTSTNDRTQYLIVIVMDITDYNKHCVYSTGYDLLMLRATTLHKLLIY